MERTRGYNIVTEVLFMDYLELFMDFIELHVALVLQ